MGEKRARYSLAGTLTVEQDDETLVLGEGETVAVVPEAIHAFRNDSKTAHDLARDRRTPQGWSGS